MFHFKARLGTLSTNHEIASPWSLDLRDYNSLIHHSYKNTFISRLMLKSSIGGMPFCKDSCIYTKQWQPSHSPIDHEWITLLAVSTCVKSSMMLPKSIFATSSHGKSCLPYSVTSFNHCYSCFKLARSPQAIFANLL